MASSVKSLKGTAMKGWQPQIQTSDKYLPQNKRHEKHLRRRSRSFSSGDAHALYKHGGTNAYDVRPDRLDCLENEGFVAALPLSPNPKDRAPLSLLVLESILSKYNVNESDFDNVDIEVGGAEDDSVEIKELYNLELFSWNLEKSFEEKETNSLDEYFALLEQCLQRSYRIRSNSTGSYELPLSASCSKETTARIKENYPCGQRKNSMFPRELGNVLDKSILKENSLHAICMDDEKQEIHSNLSTISTIDKVSTAVQKTNQVKNNLDTEILHGNQPDSKSCNLLGMVSLATPVWSHDHTYCLTCSTTTNSENGDKDVSRVTRASRDGVVQLKLNKLKIQNNKIGFQTDVVRVDDDTESRDSSAMGGAHNLPNKEGSEIVIATDNTELHGLNKGRGMPYMEMYSNIPNLLEGGKETKSRDVPDKPRDTPNKERLESHANVIYEESETSDIPNKEILLVECGVTYDLLELRDGGKSRDTPHCKDREDGIISSEETNSKDINESRETPKKKICKAVENSVGADEDKPRDSTKTRDICLNPTISKNKSFSNEDVATIGRTSLTPPALPSSPPPLLTSPLLTSPLLTSPQPPLPSAPLLTSPLLTPPQPPPPTSELQNPSRSDTASPTRGSKRTRKPTRRRLDTHYY